MCVLDQSRVGLKPFHANRIPRFLHFQDTTGADVKTALHICPAESEHAAAEAEREPVDVATEAQAGRGRSGGVAEAAVTTT